MEIIILHDSHTVHDFVRYALLYIILQLPYISVELLWTWKHGVKKKKNKFNEIHFPKGILTLHPPVKHSLHRLIPINPILHK